MMHGKGKGKIERWRRRLEENGLTLRVREKGRQRAEKGG